MQAQCDASFTVNQNGNDITALASHNSPGWSHYWQFGDGQQGWGQNAWHTYTTAGTYAIKHIVTDSLNTCRDSATQTVTISATATCKAGFTYKRDSLDPFIYRFSSTSNGGGSNIVSYNWTLNGNPFSSAASFTDTLAPGNNMICLTINTAAGCTASWCDSVVVVDTPYNCDLNPGFTATPDGATVYLQAADTRPLILHKWKFGDGTQGFGRTPSHSYGASGNYIITHYVTDSTSNCVDSSKQTVTISVQPTCQASFNFWRDSVQDNKYHFYSTSSAPGQSIQSYSWTIDGVFASSAQAFSKTLPDSAHRVCLTITTSGNCSSTVCDSIGVDTVIITLPPPTCQASYTYRRDSIDNNKYYFQSTSTSTAGAITSYLWKINNNTVSIAPAFSYNLAPGWNTLQLYIITNQGCTHGLLDSIMVVDSSITTNHINYVPSFPNPAEGSFVNLQLNLEDDAQVKITVLNSFGIVVHKIEQRYNEGFNRISIPIEKLRKGQYFIDIQYGNVRKRSRFVKF